ncbi:MAG TPA: 4-alpha-glucanotransferase [Gemmatimonadaceae bacterium]
MSARPALRALADALGIAPGYHGQAGEWNECGDDTRARLAAALGHPASTEREAAASLEALRAAERRAGLAAVRVVKRSAPEAAIAEVRLPEAAGGAIHWELELALEGGEVHRAAGEASRGAGYHLHLPLPHHPPLGYHQLRVSITGGSEGPVTSEQSLIVVPDRCTDPAELLGEGGRGFGLVANLYTVRSARDWGVGDFTDLATLAEWAGSLGAAFVGVNPLHALHNRGGAISPYSPVSRLFRNPLYLDPRRIPEVRESLTDGALLASPGFQRDLDAVRDAGMVQYEAVMALKRPVLRAAFDAFVERASPDRRQRFAAWGERREPALGRFATFMALAERFGSDWSAWPDGFSDSGSDTVHAFRAAHADEVEFHRWMQWMLDEQLEEAAARGREAGLAIGIYQDLAIGTAAMSADVWSDPALFVPGVNVGAPPDPYSAVGQDWGLPPINPRRLARDRYRYWISLLRAGFRHAGALRIDHVLGLFRLFWIPQGLSGAQGAYLQFPTQDLLGILALESVRHRAIVVGEDLGTVPPEVPGTLRAWGVLSSKVMLFERGPGGRFTAPGAWEPQALATANTHDMAPLEGWWRGRDVKLRIAHGLVPPEGAAQARREREVDREELQRALASEGIAPAGYPGASYRGAVHDFLAGSAAVLVGVSLDDIAGESEPVNLPGTGPDQFPSWQRRMRCTLEQLAAGDEFREALGTRLRALRGAAPSPHGAAGGR